MVVDPPCGSVNQGSPMDVSIVSRGWVGGSVSHVAPWVSPPLTFSTVLNSAGIPGCCFKTTSRQWQFQWQFTPSGFNLVGPYLVG